MTELLYQTDSYLKEFAALVTSVRGSELALDRTAFYPGGGGQPHDLGEIFAGDQVRIVQKVGKDKNDGEVWHQIEGEVPHSHQNKFIAGRHSRSPHGRNRRS
ncbi:MAG: alanine--tRNA ligase-related protein [bacterium]